MWSIWSWQKSKIIYSTNWLWHNCLWNSSFILFTTRKKWITWILYYFSWRFESSMVWYNSKISYVPFWFLCFVLVPCCTFLCCWCEPIGHVLFQLTLLHCAFIKYDDTIGLITICPSNIDHGSLTIVIKFSMYKMSKILS